MIFKFLGTGPTEPVRREREVRTNSSLLISDNNFNCLIDCTPNFLEQVKKENLESIDFVLLTHAHSDAIGGLSDLDKWTKKLVTVYAPVKVLDNERLKKEFKNLSFKPIRPNEKTKLQNLEITPFSLIHAEAFPTGKDFPAFGYRINDLVYAEDMEKIPEQSEEFFRDADYLIIDAAMWFDRQIRGHLNTQQALELIKKFNPKTGILTQTGHTYPNRKESLARIREEWNKIKEDSKSDILLAYDGMTIKTAIMQTFVINEPTLQRTISPDVAGTPIQASPLGPIQIEKEKRKKIPEEEIIPIEEIMIKDVKEYEPSGLNNKQLADDWRIVSAWYSTYVKTEGKGIKYSKEDIINIAKRIYDEIQKRIKEGKMKHEFEPDKMKPTSLELYKIVSGKTLFLRKLDAEEFLASFDDFKIIKDFISLVGSTAEKKENPNDIDLLIRLANPTNFLRRAIEVRILKSLPEELVSRIHFIWGDPEGPHDTFVPLYDLKLERIKPQVFIKMSKTTEMEPLKPYLPEKPAGSALYEIKDVLEKIKW